VAKGVNSNHGSLVDLLESLEHFLKRVDIYTRIPPTPATDDIVFKILLELLSTLALATKELKQGRSSESALANVLLYFALLSAVQSGSSRKERKTSRQFYRDSTGSRKMRLGLPQLRLSRSSTVLYGI